MKANTLIVLALFAVVGTGCAGRQVVPPPPPPPSNWIENPGVTPLAPAVVPFKKDEWLELTAINGDWRWAKEGTLSVARLSLANGRERMVLTCDPSTRVVILKIDAVANAGMALITTTATSRAVKIAPDPTQPGTSRISFDARDPLLDAIAFSRGRFMVQQSGATPNVAPVQPELSRVIEDCR